jgi:hypothetical protein
VSALDARSDAIVSKYEVAEMPAIRVYDSGGRLVARFDGYVNGSALLRGLARARSRPR